MVQTHRQASGSTPTRTSSIASRNTSASYGRASAVPELDRKESYSSPSRKESSFVPPSRVVAAPPPYTTTTTSSSSIAGIAGKKAPPPPPPLKPKPSYNAVKYATAIFDFEAQVCRPTLCFQSPCCLLPPSQW